MFEFNPESSNARVIPKDRQISTFSGLATDETKILLIDQSPMPRQISLMDLRGLSGKRVAAFAKFSKIEEGGRIILLHMDRLTIVVLCEKDKTSHSNSRQKGVRR